MPKPGTKMNNTHEVQYLIFKIYKDILKGYNFSKAMEKLQRNGYNTSIDTSKCTYDTNKKYYYDALKMLKVDQSEIDDLRTLFYQRMEHLYKESLEANDRTNALGTLKEMSKLMGLAVDKVDVTTTNVVDIKFGFNEKEED